MDEKSIRDRLRTFSDAMDSLSLETMKIAKVQADLVDVKKENTTLMGKVSFLEKETTILKNENTSLKNDVDNLKTVNINLNGEMGVLKKANIGLTNIVSGLQNDVQMLKSAVMSKEGNYKFLCKNFLSLEIFLGFSWASN